jgi:hypothetical protein
MTCLIQASSLKLYIEEVSILVYKKIILSAFSIGLIASILVGCTNNERSDISSTTRYVDDRATSSNEGTNSPRLETKEQNSNSDSEKSKQHQANKSDEDDKLIVYVNEQYGFNFFLPRSWDKYSIITDKWEGRSFDSLQGEKVMESGLLISIRHPLWTKNNPRQDIPIMIFTFSQWDLVEHEKLFVSAAPVIPSEICRNSKYVFALPARYNYAYNTGYEEVENILKSNPIHAIVDWKYLGKVLSEQKNY